MNNNHQKRIEIIDEDNILNYKTFQTQLKDKLKIKDFDRIQK